MRGIERCCLEIMHSAKRCLARNSALRQIGFTAWVCSDFEEAPKRQGGGLSKQPAL